MENNIIISYAILKVNYDERKDYIENFVPMFLECIRVAENDIISLNELQEIFHMKFGLLIPIHTIDMIVKRIKIKGYISISKKKLVREDEKINSLNFHEKHLNIMENHEKLIKSLIVYCEKKFNLKLTEQEAESALLNYIENNQLSIALKESCGQAIPSPGTPIKEYKYIVASFIQSLIESDSVEFEYLEGIVKGSMIACALYIPNINNYSQRFKRTEVYFDTTFLINALGYSGKAYQDPCRELLELLNESGAVLRCFKHTVEEIYDILCACSHKLDSNNIDEYFSDCLRYFIELGYTPSDVMSLANDIENSLKRINIHPKERPDYSIYKDVIGEEDLKKVLKEQIFYRKEIAIERDVYSISAIMRLRKGHKTRLIEECKALFVTSNSTLCNVVYDFFKDVFERDQVKPIITDYALTNLLWLKKPIKAPDLPKKKIIADCYAATQPSVRLWNAYIKEIDSLKSNKQISIDNYMFFKHAPIAKDILMEVTKGNEDVFRLGKINDIIRIAQERIESEVTKKKDEEITVYKNQIAQYEDREKQGNSIIKQYERVLQIEAKKFAHSRANFIKYLILAILALGSLTTFPWGLPSIFSSINKYLISLAQLCLFGFGLFCYKTGKGLDQYLGKLEGWLYSNKLANMQKNISYVHHIDSNRNMDV